MRKVMAFLGIIFLTSGYCAVLPQSGDVVLIDDFRYVIIAEGDWMRVTNDIATCCATWDKLNSTENGRIALHGKRGHSTITNGEIRVEYADGYTHAETAKENAIRNMRTPEDAKDRKRPNRMKELREKRKAIISKPIEVTIEREAGK